MFLIYILLYSLFPVSILVGAHCLAKVCILLADQLYDEIDKKYPYEHPWDHPYDM